MAVTEPSPAERYAAARRRAEVERGELAQFRELLAFPLDDFQADACAALERGSGVLVAAPTGAGKTVVGEFAVHLALSAGRKAFYTTPIKALSNQKYADLVRRYGPDRVGLLTGDTTINGDAPVVVMTTEVLRNMLYAGSPTLLGLGFVVMDEVHYLADRFRGPVWEEVIIHLPDDVQLVSLSATVSNAEEFGDWLATVRGDTAVVVSEHRPVPLGQHVLVRGDLLDLYAGHVDPTDPGVDPPINPDLVQLLRRTDGPPVRRGPGDRGYRGRGGHRPGSGVGRPTPRFAVVDALDRDGLLPAIVFIFSRAGCEGAVQQCLAAGVRLTDPAEQATIRRVVEERCAAVPPEDLDVLGYWDLLEALTRGVAAHHAGMLPLFKETVEDLFSRGLVKVVFATETLALGINMPARSVVLEKLVKWDGSNHVDVTPGEYTQLTGRAGRRGIDTEGHAVVVAHPGLDPVQLAGLASKRLYPLRSSFRPTYNMSVNLVAQVGRARAREVLETSFAQFQADRGVVGLARQAQSHAEALEGYAEAMRCHLGDFGEYARIRRDITRLEREQSRAAAGARRAEAARSLEGLRVGDVLELPVGRRSGHAVVVDPGGAGGFDGPRPTVLTTDRQVRRLTVADVGPGARTVGYLRVPKGFNVRVPAARRELAAALRSSVDGAGADDGGPRRDGRRGRAGGRPTAAQDDAQIAALRRRLRAHPCHACPDRDEHARWAERWERLRGEHDALVRRIEGRTGSIAVVFDRICDVLARLGYVARTDDGLAVTDDGQWLRRLYAENDLLLAECLRRGLWDELDPPQLAAAVSTLVYRSRREDQGEPRVPGGPASRLGVALDATVRAWSELEDLEAANRLETTVPLDLGLVEAVHRWSAGRSLDAVLRGAELSAGDFVRWCKQVIDVLDQVAKAAPHERTRTTAARAVDSLRRGVVAYSSV
ncbi:DEAD/DEAH box helicase [Cellulomonas fimi]|uniref:DEAD/DEAH box helicase domain protein n=1 Tax=Cellulomonas fimi (strain ATCC 484 / DSM 20113 / JCM 1341 / CCUG 24087 / LMG 16345 / NBRC 15513 / NCIMB 8980 / NCTC 7547 / NRS-133) TaxID=590998 RepID=F4GZN6_CELFA|nr:DEAD/DEAH box helicase domain protein [Cellulomonas fimi ATCC 484]VEH31547.1 ski2-like helicase [Cellulomonas fimi]